MMPRKAIARIILVLLLSVMGISLLSLVFNSSVSAAVNADPYGAARLPQAIRSVANAPQATSALTDTTVADFQAGSGCYVAPSAGGDLDGEVILTPTIGVTFTGDALPSGWYSGTYGEGGAVTVSNGSLIAMGAYAATSAAYPPSQTLEFSATFSAAPSEHIGLTGSDNLDSLPWAIFSTRFDGTNLYAWTQILDSPEEVTLLGSGYIGTPHRYQIAWTDTSIVYSIDGEVVATHSTVTITNDMRPIVSSAGTGILEVDWMRMSPYAGSCMFESRVLDACESAHWLNLTSTYTQPVGTVIGGVQTRSGRVDPPDATWSSWTSVGGITITSPNGRYIQYRVSLTTTDPMKTPVLESVALSFMPASQAISFAPLPDRTYGDPPFTVVATATSGLPVAFAASGGVCSVTGITVTLTGAGTCSIGAHQPGNAIYDPAPSITRTFTISKAIPTVVVTGGTFTYDGQPHPATGFAYGIGGESEVLNPPLTFTYNGLGVPPVAVGTYNVVGSFAGNNNYFSATNTAMLTITQATPVITWTNPSDIVYGTPLGEAQLNATASVVGTFEYTPISGTVLNAGAGQPLRVDFTPTDAANYLTATKTVAITVTQATPVITWTSPSDIVYGTPLGEAQLNATASTVGSFAYTPISGTVLNAGAGQPLRVDFTPTDAANYLTATKTVAITVTQATPVITWTSPSDIVYGTPLGEAQLNATASTAGSFAYTPISGTVLNAGAGQPLQVDFTPTDAGNYLTATKTVAITVTQAIPTVVVTGGTFTYDGLPHTASGFAYGVGGESDVLSPPLTFTYNGLGTPPVAAGVYSVVGSFAGNTNYFSMTNTATLTITKAAQTIAFSALPDKVIGDPPFVVTATASSGLAVTFGVSGDCTIAGDTITLIKAGSCTVTAQQAGDDNYLPALDVTHVFTIQAAKIYLPFIVRSAP
jgi:hypothetical protein